MFSFSLPRDTLIIGAMFLVVVSVTIAIEYLKLHTPPRLAGRIAFRAALFFGIPFVICWLLGVAAWLPFAVVLLLPLILAKGMLLLGGPAAGMVLMPIFSCLHRFLVGAPSHIEASPLSLSSGPPGDTLEQLIGKHGITDSPLRPAGSVLIENERYPACAADGKYIDPRTAVAVCSVRNGTLQVRAD